MILSVLSMSYFSDSKTCRANTWQMEDQLCDSKTCGANTWCLCPCTCTHIICLSHHQHVLYIQKNHVVCTTRWARSRSPDNTQIAAMVLLLHRVKEQWTAMDTKQWAVPKLDLHHHTASYVTYHGKRYIFLYRYVLAKAWKVVLYVFYKK